MLILNIFPPYNLKEGWKWTDLTHREIKTDNNLAIFALYFMFFYFWSCPSVLLYPFPIEVYWTHISHILTRPIRHEVCQTLLQRFGQSALCLIEIILMLSSWFLFTAEMINYLLVNYVLLWCSHALTHMLCRKTEAGLSDVTFLQ